MIRTAGGGVSIFHKRWKQRLYFIYFDSILRSLFPHSIFCKAAYGTYSRSSYLQKLNWDAACTRTIIVILGYEFELPPELVKRHIGDIVDNYIFQMRGRSAYIVIRKVLKIDWELEIGSIADDFIVLTLSSILLPNCSKQLLVLVNLEFLSSRMGKWGWHAQATMSFVA